MFYKRMLSDWHQGPQKLTEGDVWLSLDRGNQVSYLPTTSCSPLVFYFPWLQTLLLCSSWAAWPAWGGTVASARWFLLQCSPGRAGQEPFPSVFCVQPLLLGSLSLPPHSMWWYHWLFSCLLLQCYQTVVSKMEFLFIWFSLKERSRKTSEGGMMGHG